MKILFLCTANSCRSILCEAIFNAMAPAGMRAYSAGSHPAGVVNPMALQTLQAAGIAIDGLFSKSTDALAELQPELVITVCDKAAGEACPVFFGAAVRAHWGLSDPSELRGTDGEIAAAFDATLARIRTRIQAFLALHPTELDSDALKAELARIGAL